MEKMTGEWGKFKRFSRLLLPFWGIEVLILLLSAATVGLGLINPYLTKLIIDRAYANKDLKLFITLIAIGGLVFILTGAVSGLSSYLNRYIRLKVGFNLNRRIFKKLQELPYGFFQNSSTGQHLYKISYDVDQVTFFIADSLPQSISLIPKSILIFIVVSSINWKMALFAAAFAPVLYLIPYYFTLRLKKMFRGWVENSQKIFSRLSESLTHMQLIKAFGKEKEETRSYIKSLIKNIRFNINNTRLEVVSSFANNMGNRFILGLIIFYGGYQVIKHEMTLGSLSAITIYLSQLSGLQGSLANFFQRISLGLVSCDRLEKILDADAEPLENKDSSEAIFSDGRVDFKNVTFGYGNGRIITDNLSFYIKPSSCIGLVGPSGCGKTTIVNLILRLYRPLSGEILVAGNDITKIKSAYLYSQIGVVLQEPYLWNDTVENNIRYGKKEASLQEIKESAGIARVDEFVEILPEGYATVIGENACRISEGQKQRIAIARALIKKPKILILDEALSSVDAQKEAEIIHNIREKTRGMTLIIISHRLSTISEMDSVYFIENPGHIDIDTHEGLLNRNAGYKKYLAHQLR